MLNKVNRLLWAPPEAASGSGGTPDNATSQSGTPRSSGSVTSGTASEALLKAVAESSSDSTPVVGDTAGSKNVGAPVAKAAGDTAATGGPAKPVATSDATGQQPPQVPAGQAPANTNEAPETRIQAAVTNARNTLNQQWNQRFAPFKDFKAEDVADIKSAIKLVRDLRANPQSFYERLGKDLKVPAPGQGTTDELPQAEFTSPDGKHQFYTAKTTMQLVNQAVAKAVAAVEERLGGVIEPIQQHFQTEEDKAQERQVAEETKARTGEILTHMATLPQFTENQTAIGEALAAMPVALKRRLGAAGALMQAYNSVVLPKYDQAAEARVREADKKKAAASAGNINPANTGGSGTKVEIKGVDGLARHMEQLATQAAG